MTTSTKVPDSVIDTIQRLFALSTSPNKYEAELALAKANELLIKHNLSMAEIRAKDFSNKTNWVNADFFASTSNGPERFINSILHKYFFVRVVISYTGKKQQQLWKIFGDEPNVLIAVHVFTYLARIYKDLWKAHKLATRAQENEKKGYWLGLTAGFAQKLESEKAQVISNSSSNQNALLVINSALDIAWRKQYPSLGNAAAIRIANDRSYSAGVRDGQKISLNKAITSTQNRPAGFLN